MRSQTNRRAIIISALLTALVLTLVAGGILLSDRLAAQAASSPQALPAAADAAAAQTVQPTDPDAAIAAYEARLQESYQALQDAYAQINARQAGQSQAISDSGLGYEHVYEREHHEDHEREHDDD